MVTEDSSTGSGESSVTITRKTGPNGAKVRDSSEGRASREQLLCDSTSADDPHGLSTPTDKIRPKQRGKQRKRRISHDVLQSPSTGVSKTLGVFILLISLIAAGATVWLFFDIRSQITTSRYQIEKVSAGTLDLPEQIQNCRSVNRQLKRDLAELSDKMQLIKQKFDNFSVKIDHVQQVLQDVQGKLHSYPELINVPNDIDELSKNVANFGSQLQDIQLKTNQLSDEKSSVVSDLTSVKTNLSAMHDSLDSLKNNAILDKSKSKGLSEEEIKEAVENQIKDELMALNMSFTTRLNWTSTDQLYDHKTIGALEEKFANLSSQLQTFTEDLTSLTQNVSSLNREVGSLKSTLAGKAQSHSTPTDHESKKPTVADTKL